LARTLESLYDYAEARSAYRRATELDPNHESVWGNYAAHLLRVGRDAEAEEVIAKGRQLPWFDLNRYLRHPREERPK
jgi:Flp pilus assembly protein TadD